MHAITLHPLAIKGKPQEEKIRKAAGVAVAQMDERQITAIRQSHPVA